MCSGLQPYSNHVLRKCLKVCWTYATNCKMGLLARALGSMVLRKEAKKALTPPAKRVDYGIPHGIGFA